MAAQSDDEKAIRAALFAMGVGPVGAAQSPTPAAPPIPPMPSTPPPQPAAPRKSPAAPAPAGGAPKQPKPKPPAKPKKPKKQQVTKPKKPKASIRKSGHPKRHDPASPRTAWDTRPPSPRQSLVDAWARVPYRLKWLAYHLAAAYLGWMVGLVGWATYVTAWIAATGMVGFQAAFWYAAAAGVFLLHRRTRSWWWPVAFLAAVPASSTVVGVLLYGTPHP